MTFVEEQRGSRPTGAAKYAQVRDHLSERIAQMQPGDRLPTEPMLCREYSVSRITVRRAVDDLIREGRVVREQGRGTFVTEPRYIQQVRETFANRVTGFYRQQSDLGRDVGTQVVANHLVRDPVAAQALGLNPADELVELERLRYVNGTLHQHVLTYLPAARFSKVLDEDLGKGSLYDRLEQKYGVVLAHNEILARLDRPSGRIAEALEIRDGECVLAIESKVYDTQGAAVAFGVARHTPSNSEIAISLGTGT
jgi:DNA-binding GntR family transcriptional regulator